MKRTLVAVVGALLALGLPAASPHGLTSSARETNPFSELVNGLWQPILAAQTERGASPTVAPPQGSPRALDGPRYPAHYVVVEASGDGPMRVVHYQRVMLSGQPESLSDAQLATRATLWRGRQTHTASVRLRDTSGRVAHQALVRIPRWQRVETLRPEADPAARETGARMEGHVEPLVTATFVVRVPVLAGVSRLEISYDDGRDGGRGAALQAPATELDLDAIASEFGSSAAALQAAPSALVESLSNNGQPANRLDLLYVGEGYPSGDLSWFRSDTSAFAAGFVSGSPMFEYAQHFNLWRLHVPSTHRGADRPSCPDDAVRAAGQDTNTFVDTAFDATYCSGNAPNRVWRLLTVDVASVMQAAAACPDWDEIIVVVQSPIRGGSGGPVAVTSLNPGYVIDADILGVMLHEFGHSFANLADEYTSRRMKAPCSDINADLGDQCEPNVTDETRATHIKWRRWFLPGTPIPTFGPLAGARDAGLWEGARYLTDDIYRQCFNGRMNTATQPFCRVDAEAILLKLYAGGWGAPAAGIYTIEPSTRIPAGSQVSVNPGQTRRLQARVLGPVMGGSLKIQWFVNNLLFSRDHRGVRGNRLPRLPRVQRGPLVDHYPQGDGPVVPDPFDAAQHDAEPGVVDGESQWDVHRLYALSRCQGRPDSGLHDDLSSPAGSEVPIGSVTFRSSGWSTSRPFKASRNRRRMAIQS